MSSPSETVHGAEVVDLTRVRSKVAGKNRDGATRHTATNVPVKMRAEATLLSMRSTLLHHASVGIRDIDDLRANYSKVLVNTAMANVRSLLETEFGYLRVHRYRQAFAVGHHCAESLIGGLLRVQYYAHELQLPVTGEQSAGTYCYSPRILWGIGDSISEAEKRRVGRC